MSHLKSKRAFTLVELLIVIAIIGVLAAISMMGYRIIRAKAQDARKKADLRLIAQALEAYSLDKGDKYPASRYAARSEEPLTEINAMLYPTGPILVKGEYISVIPQDPATNKSYSYYTPYNREPPTCTGSPLQCDSFILKADLSAEPGQIYTLASELYAVAKGPDGQPYIPIDTPPTWVDGSFTVLAEKVSDTSVKIRWGLATDIVPPVSYKVVYGQAQQRPYSKYGQKEDYFPAPSVTPLTLNRQYTLTNLTPGQNFKFYIVAVDVLGQETPRYGQKNPNQFFAFSWGNDRTPVWSSGGIFAICTKTQCDEGFYGLSPTNPHPITENNKVGFYVSGALGTQTPPAAYCDSADGAVLEYKLTSATEWNEFSFRPVGAFACDAVRYFYIGAGTYNFRVRSFNNNGRSAYYPDPANPSEPLVKTRVVEGKPEGEDYTPPQLLVYGFGFTYKMTCSRSGFPQTPDGYQEYLKQCCPKTGVLGWTAGEDDVALDHYDITIDGTWYHYVVDPITRDYDFSKTTSGTVHLSRKNIITNRVTLPIDRCNDNTTVYNIKLTAYDVNGNVAATNGLGSMAGATSAIFQSDP